jgi:hypothetical protein
MVAGCREAVGRSPNLWATMTASRRESAVPRRGVPGQAVAAGAVLMTTLLVQRMSSLFVMATVLPQTLCQSRILRQQMGEKESGNAQWSV